MVERETSSSWLDQEITVVTMAGTVLAVIRDVHPGMTVKELAEQATVEAVQNGHEMEKMELTLEGRKLHNDEILGDLGLSSPCTLSAALSAPGYDASLQLSSDDVRSRMAAAEALGKVGPNAAPYADKLAELLLDKSAPLRRRVAEALCRIGPAAVPCVAEYLEENDPQVRKLVLGILCKVDGAAAEPYIPQLVKQLKDAGVRHVAAETLAHIGDASALATAALLADSDAKIRACAADILSKFGKASEPFAGQLCVLFRDDNSVVRCNAVKALVAIGALAVSHAAALLGDDDLTVRRCATEALGGIGPAAAVFVPQIQTLLEAPRVEVQACARKALQQILADRTVVLAALHQDGNLLEFVADEFKSDHAIVLAAVAQNGEALQFAAEELRSDPQFRLVSSTMLQKPCQPLAEPASGAKERSFDQMELKQQDAEESTAAAVFRHLNTDGSGTISQQNLADVLQRLDETWTDKRINELFLEADGNRDGVIHLAEFAAWIFAGSTKQQALQTAMAASLH